VRRAKLRSRRCGATLARICASRRATSTIAIIAMVRMRLDHIERSVENGGAMRYSRCRADRATQVATHAPMRFRVRIASSSTSQRKKIRVRLLTAP
jgi:hypothetical protein